MIVDFSNLCAHREKISDLLVLENLQRINQLFALQSQTLVHFQISGSQEQGGYGVVDVSLSTTLQVTCQRCMNEFPFAINSTRQYLLEGDQTDKSLSIVGNMEILEKDKIDIEEFISDELLLCLPISIMHDKEQCPSAKYMDS